MKYKYVTDDNLENKQTYMYTEYEGYSFLAYYEESRTLISVKHKNIVNNVNVETDTLKKLKKLYECLVRSELIDTDIKKEIDFYNKTFEIKKRIYGKYNDDGKPDEGAGYRDYNCYIMLSKCLIEAYKKTGCLKYFSCLLKIDDTLISLQNELDLNQIEQLKKVIEEEKGIYSQLKEEILGSDTK